MLKDDKEVQELKEPIEMIKDLSQEIDTMINTYNLMKSRANSEPKQVALHLVVCSLENLKDQLASDCRRCKGALIEHLLETGKI